MAKYFFLNTSKENMSLFQTNWKGIYGNRASTKGVVLHDAAAGMGATAKSVAQYTVGSMDNANYHNSIDDKGNCYAVVNMKIGAYHTGNTYGNDNYIGIEIAPTLTSGDFKNQSERDKYYKAWINGCKLTADYLVYYGLNETHIKQHNEFKSTACPYSMKMYFGSYGKALSQTKNKVKEYIQIIKNNGKEVKDMKYYAKVETDLWEQTRYTVKNANYLMKFEKEAGAFADENLEKKHDTPNFKAGQKVVSKFHHTIKKHGYKYWVHRIDKNEHGKVVYFAYKREEI